MHSSDKDQLLRDVLHDANYEAFRIELEELCRAELRRKNRKSGPAWFALAAALTIGALILYWGSSSSRSSLVLSKAPELSPAKVLQVVESRALTHEEIVRSAPDLGLLLKTSPRSVETVRTDTQRPVSELSDSELMALLPNGAGGFVTMSGTRRLVLFLEPEAKRRELQEGFGPRSGIN